MGGDQREAELLASAYRESLKVAAENNLVSIAFPSISTGAYGFPVERAARIAVRETRKFLQDSPLVEQVRLVCFGQDACDIYSRALAEALRK